MVKYAQLITEQLLSDGIEVRFAWEVNGSDVEQRSKELIADLDTRYMQPVVYAIRNEIIVAVAYRTIGDFTKNYNYKAVIGVSSDFKSMEHMYKKMISYMLVEYMHIKERAPWWYAIEISAGSNHKLRTSLRDLGFRKTFPGEYEWNWSQEDDGSMKMVKHKSVVTKRYDAARFKDKEYNRHRAIHFISKHLISIGKGSETYPPTFNINGVHKGASGVTLDYSYIDSTLHRRTGGRFFGFHGNIMQKLPTGKKGRITIKLNDW